MLLYKNVEVCIFKKILKNIYIFKSIACYKSEIWGTGTLSAKDSGFEL